MFTDGLKFCEQFFKRGHQKLISRKLFQNLSSDFREEEYLRISCP